VAQKIVNRRQVNVQLAYKCWIERDDFQLDDDEAPELEMVEEYADQLCPETRRGRDP
jgi:hypothetical protein